MTRIGRLFEHLKREGRKGLIAYITAAAFVFMLNRSAR